MSKTQETKAPGKCAALHQMWNDAGDGQPLPRNFAVEMAIAAGVDSFKQTGDRLRPDKAL